MESFAEHYASMCATVQTCMPGADMALIDRAVAYAREKHKDQKLKDGSPYIIHPLAVAEIVAEMGLDMDAILGALLHDCIEDTDASHDDIAKRFGTVTAELVEGVTKLTRANFSSSEEQQMENLRKMFMAMSKDIRVMLIKIADRLHNMRTMQYQSPAKQVSKCRETMDVYAPLAHRLGMQKVKWELEDIALRYLDPIGYYAVQEELDGGETAEFASADLSPFAGKGDAAAILAFFGELEILTERWRDRLAAPEAGDWTEAHRALARYFVQRYWLQAVSDYDLVSRAKLAVISCLVIKLLGGDTAVTAQLYSKEIENDADNVDAILDGTYTAPALTDANLLGLLLTL